MQPQIEIRNQGVVLDTQGLLLSRWFWYAVIYFALSLILLNILLLPLKIEELPTNFLAEVFGLLFTLTIFMMILDFREILEWKSVEKRVKRRIGDQIFQIFNRLIGLYEVEEKLLGDYSDDAWKKMYETQLNSLVSGELEFSSYGKDSLLPRKNVDLVSYLDSKRASLSGIENKYNKFLGYKLQTSLMDIQDYLERLNSDLRYPFVSIRENVSYNEHLSDLIRKIMTEIAKLRQSGIDIGF